MGGCLSCLIDWLDDGEPSTYEAINPLLPENKYSNKTKYIFTGPSNRESPSEIPDYI